MILFQPPTGMTQRLATAISPRLANSVYRSFDLIK
jgi:hypothetical protein